jgi:hypothetical protein
MFLLLKGVYGIGNWLALKGAYLKSYMVLAIEWLLRGLLKEVYGTGNLKRYMVLAIGWFLRGLT